MAGLRLDLLGGFALGRDGAPERLAPRKAQLLLGFLAVARRRTLPRTRLAALLWERADPEGARTSLRQAVAQVRRACGAGWIEAEDDGLRLGDGVLTDVGAFAEALGRGDDAEAARLYAGPFLDGSLPDGPDLAAAVGAERARLADLAAGALRRELERIGDRPEAARAAHDLLVLDPLDEAAHRALMSHDAARGARGAARARFDGLRDALRRELGVEPAPETAALMDRIRHVGRGRAAPAPNAPPPSEVEPGLLLLALEAEEGADWPVLRAAAEGAGGAPLECGPGEAGTLWAAADLRTVAATALAMARAAGPTASFGLVAAAPEDAGEGPAARPRALARARRIAARADPGGVLVAADLAPRLGLAARGGSPVPLSPEAAAPRPDPPIVGREVEIAQIDAACAAARAAGAGIVVHLSGEAGIGKTRLAAEVAHRPDLRAGRVVRAGFPPFAAGGRHVAQDLMAGLGDAAPDPAEDAFDRAVRAWLSGATPTGEIGLRLSALSDEERRRRTLDVLARTMAASASAAGGLVAVIEDCHWAPVGTGDFILELAERLAAAPVTLLLTERPHEASLDRRLATRGRTGLIRLRLAPLSPGAAARLAALAAPGRADAGEALERAGGHPLFLLRLLEAGWTRGNLPDSVTGLVLEQIERLPAQDRDALRHASLLGRAFDPADVAAIFPEAPPPRPHDDVLHVAGSGLAFGHDLIRQAIHDALPAGTRLAWHARAAAYFRGRDPLRWAEHAALGADDAEACRAATAAANAMIAAMRLTTAMDHIEAGLARGGDPEAVAELHSCRAGIRRMRGDLFGALEDYRAAHAAAVSETTRVAMLVRRALVLHRLDRGEEADRALDEAEAVADRIGLSGLGRAEIHEQRGNRAFVMGDPAECLRQHAAGLAVAEASGDPRGIARAHGGLGDAHFAAGRLRTAHRHFDRAVTLAARAGLGMAHQEFAFMRSYALFFAEPGPRAHLLADLAVEDAAGAGADRAEMIARETRAEMRLAALDLAGAREDIERLQALLDRAPESRFAADLTVLRAWLAIREGDARGASAQLAPHLAAARGSHYNGAILLVLAALAAPDPGLRADLIAAGEARLAEGALSCAAIWFGCFALECAARHEDRAQGLRQIARLEALAASEPLGLVDLALGAARLRFGGAVPADGPEAARRALAAARLAGLGGILDGRDGAVPAPSEPASGLAPP